MCRVALELARMHGLQFAAAFLAENHVSIEVALFVLVRRETGGADSRAIV